MDCPFKKNRKNKVFAIEKKKCTKMTSLPENDSSEITESLKELIHSNNQVLNFLGGNTIKMENISKYLHLNYNEDICGVKVNLNEVYTNYQIKLQEIIFYSQYFKNFYQVPQDSVNFSKKLPSKLFSTIKPVSNSILKDIVDKSTASLTESEFKIK
jgi:copper homeostasis protein CutC